MRRPTVAAVLAGAALVGVTGTALATAGGPDAGLDRQHQQEAHSLQYFGVVSGLPQSSDQDVDPVVAAADPTRLVTLAKGLRASVVTAGKAAPNLDMAVLWPADNPRWLVSCNEQGTSDPGVQRIDLRTGEVTTVITGTASCDPLHVTPWGTVVFGEEAGASGAAYEMVDPTRVTGVRLDRATGTFSGGVGADQVVRRDALGFLSYEGLGILPSGVAYYGDELGPSSGGVGGAYYKFVPDRPWDGRTQVTSLADSPLASGTVYGLRVGQGSNSGQGMSYGDGSWVRLEGGRSLRDQAAAARLTGYYRPEDLSLDERQLAAGQVRFCGNNTGREQAHYYGETICVTDGSTAEALAGTAVPQVRLLVPGSPELNMPDNIDYQPGRGNWIVHEDGETDFERPHGDDLWSCLDDGDDADQLGDGCIRIASVNDLSAEFTGGFFDRTGQHFYVSVQHSTTGRGVVLDITGWR
jgi:hypothetical protein